MPSDKLEDYVEAELGHPVYDNWGFQMKVARLLHAKGPRPDWKPSWMRPWTTSMMELVTSNQGWEAAAKAAIKAVAEAVTTQGVSGRSSSSDPHLLQFGALIRAIGFDEVPAYDVHQWTKAYDRAAVRETLRVFTEISAIDSAQLAMEAAFLIRRLDAEPDLTIFTLNLPVVDVPEPTWQDVLSAAPDRALLQRALHHGSTWLAKLATNLLQAIPTDEAGERALFSTARGFGLAAVAHLASVHCPERAADMVIDRLEGDWVPGMNYLFRTLQQIQLPVTDRLMNVLNKGLTGESVRVAEAAAALASDLVTRGVLTDPGPIERAFAHWQAHEEPSPSHGIIPSSPRETLLRILLTLRIVSDDRLLELLRDPRNDVRGLAEKHLLEALPHSPELHQRLVSAIVARTLTAGFAARVLASGLELSSEQVTALSTLLADPEGKWRLAATSLLRSPYLSDDEISAHATRLASDVEDKVRLRAQRLLGTHR